jgi:hypothetical protein
MYNTYTLNGIIQIIQLPAKRFFVINIAINSIDVVSLEIKIRNTTEH